MVKHLLMFQILLFCSFSFASKKMCVYQYTVWNKYLGKSTKIINVNKPYSSIDRTEKNKSGCTPCEIDQVEIILRNNTKLKVCKKIAHKLKNELNSLLDSGFILNSVVGYRPQMSRGPLNELGERTILSNHSFGVAIDINEKFNGLYTNCISWSSDCRLIKGGPYLPGNHPLSITKDSKVVKSMKKINLLWGGQISGRQKDFMHFSFSGY